MKKYLLIFIILLMPLNVWAIDSVYYGNSVTTCTNNYQDNTIYTSGSTTFSHCMKAVCTNSRYKINYIDSYKNVGVVCTNGNTNPYRTVTKSGCSKTYCGTGDVGDTYYCSQLEYVDCSKKSNGQSFTTTTTSTTTRASKRPITTTPVTETTTVAPSNTKLKSLTLSTGVISFSPDVYGYELTIESTINSIEVNAVPEDSNSTVSVTGNSNLVNGSEIVVTVSGQDGSKSEYKIKVTKKDMAVVSSNTKLKSLKIKDYSIPFNTRTNAYNLTINEGTDTLDIDAIAEDSAAIVMITGNENLKSGSKITISVTATDGTVGYYTININVKKKSNFIKILFIIILILALLAGGFYIYKKFIASKEGEKYEYE